MRSFVLVAIAAIVLAANPCIAATMPSIGIRPPAITASNMLGKSVNVSEFYGSPTILVFFTSWSKSCENEIKELNRLYLAAKKDGLKIVAVSFDKKTAPLKEFVEKNKIEFEVLMDKKLASIDKYAILIIPTTFAIDRTGNISDIFVDYDDNVATSLQKFVSAQTRK